MDIFEGGSDDKRPGITEQDMSAISSRGYYRA